MPQFSLNDHANEDERVLAVLLDLSKGPVSAAIEIHALGYVTSETAIRRWRKQRNKGQVPPAESEFGGSSSVDDFSGDFEDEAPGDETEFRFSDEDKAKLVESLTQTLDACNSDPANVVGLRVAQWNTFMKNADSEAEIHTLYGVKVLVKTQDVVPDWPLTDRAPVAQVGPSVYSAPALIHEWKTSVILPDIQAGFFLEGTELQPTHDERAIELALTILEQVDPDEVLIGGDGADFPELGRYRLSPVFTQTTQATVDYISHLVTRIRNTAPNAKVDWLEGNHEARMPNYLMDNAKAAFGLKRSGDVEKWPVLSVPFLCRFEELGVNYIAGYPAAEHWFNDNIKAMHGNKVNSSGSTVHRYLNEERVSTISFHIHRIEEGHRTRHTRYGPKTIMAASPGCLCRVDGAVPSVKGGVNLDGVPIEHSEDWQQGLAILHYQPEGQQRFTYEPITITPGDSYFAMYGGNEYRVGQRLDVE